MSVLYQSLGVSFYEELKRRNANHVLMVDEGTKEVIDCEHLLRVTVKLAEVFKNLGIKKGDTIGTLTQNNWKVMATAIAGFYIGARTNPINFAYTIGELKRLLLITKPVLILATRSTIQNIFNLMDEDFSPIIILCDLEPLNNFQTFDDLLQQTPYNERFTPINLDPKESGALILTSSGTTGLPKCVPMSHANFRITLIHARDPQIMGLSENETIISYLPFFHIFGCVTTLATIFCGTKAVILDKFLPELFLQIIQDHKITKLMVVPATLVFLAKHKMVENYDLSSVKELSCGAAVVTKEIEDLVQKRLNVKTIRQAYAMTETTSVAAETPLNCQKKGSVGLVTPLFKIKICNPDNGLELPTNQIGEIRIKSEAVVSGYLGDDEATKNAFDENGFLKSGDLGYFDDEGFLFVVGRIKEIIKHKGFQVSPAELESLLIQHPAVKDAGVVGLPSERAGELPLAFVVKQPNVNVTEEEIKRFVADNVVAYKHLQGGVYFVDEIPKNSTGKILRNKLQELVTLILASKL